MTINAVKESDSLLKRVGLMARFIAERHPAEFEAYWADNWKGTARASEALEFFGQDHPEKHLVLHSKGVL